MTKRYTSFHLILLLALFVIPNLLLANNGEPGTGMQPRRLTKADSIAMAMGHCNPITVPEVDCATRTIVLSAYINWLFTGVQEPVVVTWNTGQVAHKITVVPPGLWNWDASNTGCEPNHWNTDYNQPGAFFLGPLEIVGPSAICSGEFYELTLNNPDNYDFQSYDWNPPSADGSIVPYTLEFPGTYTLNVIDQIGCPFTDQITIVPSPPVAPTLSGPPVLCPEGDTSFVQVNQNWSHYEWNTGDTINPIQVYGPGFYEVTVTNQHGCTGVQAFGIASGEIGGVPLSVTAPAICPGQLDTIRVQGGFSQYHWSNGAFGNTTIVNQPGTYAVTVTNIYGCTAADSVTIAPLPTPTIAASSTPMCPGANSTLTVSGGTFPNYIWSNGATGNPITVNAPGTYTVTVSGSSICATSTSAIVIQSPAPTTAISPPALLTCASPQATLNATASSAGPNFTFAWTTSGGHFVSGQQTLTPVVDSSGTYTLVITNTQTGCTSSASVTVSANQLAPPAPAGGPATLTCSFPSLQIGPATPPADTALIPSWSATAGGNISAGQGTWNPTVDAPGTFILTVTNPANGCTSSASVAVGQNVAAPNALIAPPSLITCTASTVPLDGSSSSQGVNFTHQWTAANGGTIVGAANQPNATAGSVGTYILTVTNTINGCTSSTSVDVAADQNIPNVGALPPATLTCSVLTVGIDATQSSSGPTFTYTWNGPGIVSGGNSLTPTVDEPGTYTLLLVNNANSCSASFSVQVPQDIQPPVANAGLNATLNCVAPSLNLDGSGSSQGPGFIYQWTTQDGNILSGNTGLTPAVNMAGTYVLQVTNTGNGCTSTSSVQVLNDASAPVALIAPPALLTCATQQLTVDATASSQGGVYTYNWTGPTLVSGQGTLNPVVNLPGVYVLDIVNTQNGCTDTDTVTVNQDIVAPPSNAGPDVLLNCYTPAGSIGSAANPGGAGFTLQWTTPDGNITGGNNTPTTTMDAAGTYNLLVTNTANGCTSTDAVVVTEDFATPAANAGPTFELNCVQTSTVLQGTGSTGAGFTYLWTTTDGNIVSGNNTLSPTVNQAGNYDLLVTNTVNGCTNTASVDITVSADVPVALIANPALLTCTVQNIALNAGGSTSGPTIVYSWTAAAGGSITGGNTTLNPTVDAPGTYTLLITDNANNCTSTESVDVLEDVEAPVLTAASGTLTCAVTNLPMSATVLSSSSPNLAYAWSGGLNGNPVTVALAGTYTVTVTDAFNGCTATATTIVASDVTPPDALIAPPLTLTCTLQNTPVDGSASSQGTEFVYQWTTPDGNIVSGAATDEIMVNEPGTYILLVTDNSNGCTQSATQTVAQDIVNPIAAAGPVMELDCDTQTQALDGSASSQGPEFIYVWTTTDGQIVTGGTTLSPTVGDPGTYQLLVTDNSNGCTSFSTVLVTEDVDPPVFAIAPPAQLTCLTLSAPLAASGSGFGPAPTYLWTTQNGNIVSGGNTLTATADEPGTYNLLITNTENGCTDTETVTVQQNIAPPPLTPGPGGTLTCSVTQLNLAATTGQQVQVQWTTQNGNIVSGANSLTPVVDEPGTYTIVATSQVNGCTNTNNVQVNQETNVPNGLDFSLDPPLCTGVLGTVTFEAVDGGVGPFEYSVDGGQTFISATEVGGLEPGQYELVVQDANGCTAVDMLDVPAPPEPAVTLPTSFDIQIGENQELQALVPSSFPLQLVDQVIWEPMTGLTFDGNTTQALLNPVAMPFVTTEYKVTIISPEGCRAEARTIIRVDRQIDIYPPNVIWPEAPDGVNNAFTLYTRKGSVNRIVSLQVYDRWGEQMFVNQNFLPDDPTLGWDGTFKGEPMRPGVFVWWAEVELIDGKTILLKGDVTVVR